MGWWTPIVKRDRSHELTLTLTLIPTQTLTLTYFHTHVPPPLARPGEGEGLDGEEEALLEHPLIARVGEVAVRRARRVREDLGRQPAAVGHVGPVGRARPHRRLGHGGRAGRRERAHELSLEARARVPPEALFELEHGLALGERGVALGDLGGGVVVMVLAGVLVAALAMVAAALVVAVAVVVLVVMAVRCAE